MNMHSCVCCKNETNHILKISDTLKLLSVDSRLKLLCVLNSGSHCVCELVEHFDMSQSLISHHLSDLKDHKLVEGEQRGKNVYYSLTKKGKKVFNLINKISEEI